MFSQIRLRKLSDEEKAFYSSVAYDLEVITSVGWLELVVCNYRSDHDLTRHQEVSGTDFHVNDNGRKSSPRSSSFQWVWTGVYALLEKAYRKEDGRSYLALKPYIAPLQVCVFPLVTKDGLTEEEQHCIGS